MNLIKIEVIQGLSGALAVIITVPIVAFIATRLIPAMNRSQSLKYVSKGVVQNLEK